jgi:hypothetical protein
MVSQITYRKLMPKDKTSLSRQPPKRKMFPRINLLPLLHVEPGTALEEVFEAHEFATNKDRLAIESFYEYYDLGNKNRPAYLTTTHAFLSNSVAPVTFLGALTEIGESPIAGWILKSFLKTAVFQGRICKMSSTPRALEFLDHKVFKKYSSLDFIDQMRDFTEVVDISQVDKVPAIDRALLIFAKRVYRSFEQDMDVASWVFQPHLFFPYRIRIAMLEHVLQDLSFNEQGLQKLVDSPEFINNVQENFGHASVGYLKKRALIQEIHNV